MPRGEPGQRFRELRDESIVRLEVRFEVKRLYLEYATGAMGLGIETTDQPSSMQYR